MHGHTNIIFQTEVVEKIKTRILCSLIFSPKSYRLRDKVENYGRFGQAPQDILTRRVRFACWMARLQTHTEYVILITFPLQKLRRESSPVLHLYVQFIIHYHRKFEVIWPSVLWLKLQINTYCIPGCVRPVSQYANSCKLRTVITAWLRSIRNI